MLQNDNPCLRCGTCCSSAFFALMNVSIEDDAQELARWMSYFGCEPMKYPTSEGEVLAVKIPMPCKHLAREPESGKMGCLIYENRPNVCREYLCKKARDAEILELVKKHGVCT